VISSSADLALLTSTPCSRLTSFNCLSHGSEDFHSQILRFCFYWPHYVEPTSSLPLAGTLLHLFTAERQNYFWGGLLHLEPVFPLSCAHARAHTTFRLAHTAFLYWSMSGIGLECDCSQSRPMCAQRNKIRGNIAWNTSYWCGKFPGVRY